MAVVEKVDHIQKGLDTFPGLWQGKPNAIGLLKSYLETLQEVEDILFQLLEERGIYTAIGKQLDIIGALFDLYRKGQSDEVFRSDILSYLSGIGSSGTVDDVIRAIITLTSADVVKVFPHYPACSYVFANKVISTKTEEGINRASVLGARIRGTWALGDHIIPYDSVTPSPTSPTVSNLVVTIGGVDSNLIVTEAAVDSNLTTSVEENIDASGTAFTSLVPGATSYDVVDSLGVMAELPATVVDATQGFIIDHDSNYIVDQDENNVVYINYN